MLVRLKSKWKSVVKIVVWDAAFMSKRFTGITIGDSNGTLESLYKSQTQPDMLMGHCVIVVHSSGRPAANAEG